METIKRFCTGCNRTHEFENEFNKDYKGYTIVVQNLGDEGYMGDDPREDKTLGTMVLDFGANYQYGDVDRNDFRNTIRGNGRYMEENSCDYVYACLMDEESQEKIDAVTAASVHADRERRHNLIGEWIQENLIWIDIYGQAGEGQITIGKGSYHCGFIYVDVSDLRSGPTGMSNDQAETALRKEIEDYDYYLQGKNYGLHILDGARAMDSMIGFGTIDHAEQYGEESINNMIEARDKLTGKAIVLNA